MNVFSKLIKARNVLQAKELKKSGHNKFAGYKYFELSDFLPAIQEIFLEIGLVDIISFNENEAVLTLHDVDAPETWVTFRSPMGSAQLKGCHEVQNIGAVETYQRRYLYVTAMAISEHDALDATTGNVETKEEPKPPVKKIEGQKGGFQIVINEPTEEEDLREWMMRVQEASHLLLDLCATDADVMTIFKKNKVLFDTVKRLDPDFFKEMMVKFSETKNKLKKD